MRIQCASAEPWKVLSASNHTFSRESAQKASRIIHNAIGFGRSSSRAHHVSGTRKSEIKHRGQRGVEPERTHCATYKLSVLVRKGGNRGISLSRISFSHRLCRRHRHKCIAQPVHRSAFNIYAAQVMRHAKR